MSDDDDSSGSDDGGDRKSRYRRKGGGGDGGGGGGKKRARSSRGPKKSHKFEIDADKSSSRAETKTAVERQLETQLRPVYAKGRTAIHYPTKGAIRVALSKQHRFADAKDLPEKQEDRVGFLWLCLRFPEKAFLPRAQTWDDFDITTEDGKVYRALASLFVWLVHRAKRYGKKFGEGSKAPYAGRSMMQELYFERVLSTHVDENEFKDAKHVEAALAGAAVRASQNPAASPAAAAVASGAAVASVVDPTVVDETPDVCAQVIELERRHKVLKRYKSDLPDEHYLRHVQNVAKLGEIRKDYEKESRPNAEHKTECIRLHLVAEGYADEFETISCDDAEDVDGPQNFTKEMWEEECEEKGISIRHKSFVPEEDEDETEKQKWQRQKAARQNEEQEDREYRKWLKQKIRDSRYTAGTISTSRFDTAWEFIKRCLVENDLCRTIEEQTANPLFKELGPGEVKCLNNIQSLKCLYHALNKYHSDKTCEIDSHVSRLRCSLFSHLNELSPIRVFRPEDEIGLSSERVSSLQSDLSQYEIKATSSPDDRANHHYVKFPRPHCVWMLPNSIETFFETLMPHVSIAPHLQAMHTKFESMFKNKTKPWRYGDYLKLDAKRYLDLSKSTSFPLAYEAAIALRQSVLMWRCKRYGPTGKSSVNDALLTNVFKNGGIFIDLCGGKESQRHNDDFMTVTPDITNPVHRIVRAARYVSYRNLWCSDQLERRRIYMEPPVQLNFAIVTQENMLDAKQTTSDIEAMLQSKNGNVNNPDYVKYEMLKTKQLNERRFERLGRLIVDGEGEMSSAAQAFVKWNAKIRSESTYKNYYAFRGNRVFSDTTHFQEFLITIMQGPKLLRNNYKNHDHWLNTFLAPFASYGTRDLPSNILLSGENSQGKSYMINSVAEMLIPGTVKVVTNMSLMSQLTDESDISDELIMIEEASLGVFVAAQRNDAGAREIQLWKNKLTKRIQRWETFHRMPDGRRVTLRGDVIGGNSYVMAMNPLVGNHAMYDQASLSRFQEVGVKSSDADASRHPDNADSDNIPMDTFFKDLNTTRVRNLQAITWCVYKAIMTGAIKGVTLNYAMNLVFRVLDDAAERGATETRHPRNVDRVRMTIETLTILRAVYSLYFIDHKASSDAFPDAEEWTIAHLARIEPLLIPFTEEVVFALLLRSSQFENQAVRLVSEAMQNLWFGQGVKREGYWLRLPIVVQADIDRLTTWFKNPDIQNEWREDMYKFEAKYGVAFGYKTPHNKRSELADSLDQLKDEKRLAFFSVDTERFNIPVPMERFTADIDTQLKTSSASAQMSTKDAMRILTGGNSVMNRKPIPATFVYTDHVSGADPKKIQPADKHVIVAVSLAFVEDTAKPVFEAINSVLALKDREGPMWLMPETRGDGTSEWRYFRTRPNPDAKPISFPAIERVTENERYTQGRMFDKPRRDSDEALQMEYDKMRLAFDSAFKTMPGLDMAKQNLELDEFFLQERIKIVGLTKAVIDSDAKHYAYLDRATPQKVLDNVHHDIRERDGVKKYADIPRLNIRDARPAAQAPVYSATILANMDSKHGSSESMAAGAAAAAAGGTPSARKKRGKQPVSESSRQAAENVSAFRAATRKQKQVIQSSASMPASQFSRPPAAAAAAAATTEEGGSFSMAGAIAAAIAQGPVSRTSQFSSRREEAMAGIRQGLGGRSTSSTVYVPEKRAPTSIPDEAAVFEEC